MSEPRYRRAREQAGLTVKQAARILGWDTLALEEHETGHERAARYPLTDSEVTRMADIYGCSVEWLRGDHVEPPSELKRILRDADVTFSERESLLELAASIQGKR